MSREAKPTSSPSPRVNPRARVAPEVATQGDAALVRVNGMIDEKFPGFGALSGMTTVVIDVSGVTFMTSFGVAQWLKSMAALPPTATDIYLVGCPTIIVDQLNMILDFGGASKILTLSAPFLCTSCGAESREIIDVLADGAKLARGEIPAKMCSKCGKQLELDEMPESYFSCLKKYGASSASPAALQLLADRQKLHRKTVTPSIRPATNTPQMAGQLPDPVLAARKPFNLGVIIFLVILLLIAVGVYLLVGPS